MQVLSINCAMPELLDINGRPVLSGIYKRPVSTPVAVGKLTVAGDDQADKRVHGGPDQAVYCYSAKHYPHWQAYLEVDTLPYGTFGENLTLSEMDETELCIGDILQIGQVQLQVTKPRIPCFKLAHKLDSKAIIKDFLLSGFSGFYCRVLQQGEIAAQDAVQIVKRDPQNISVKTALILQKLDMAQLEDPKALLQKALCIELLTQELKVSYEKRLARL